MVSISHNTYFHRAVPIIYRPNITDFYRVVVNICAYTLLPEMLRVGPTYACFNAQLLVAVLICLNLIIQFTSVYYARATFTSTFNPAYSLRTEAYAVVIRPSNPYGKYSYVHQPL